jgi:Domain of unknown function (DUF1911)
MDTSKANLEEAHDIVEFVSPKSLRDSMGLGSRYDSEFGNLLKALNFHDHQALMDLLKKPESDTSNMLYSWAYNITQATQRRVILLYATGTTLIALEHRLQRDLAYCLAIRGIYNETRCKSEGIDFFDDGFFNRFMRDKLSFLAFPILLLSDPVQITKWLSFFVQVDKENAGSEQRSYYIDTLIKAFVSDWSVVKNKLSLPKKSRPGEWMDIMTALFGALAQPTTEARNLAMYRYMDRWNRLMKPYGWKPKRIYHPAREDGSIPRVPASDNLFVQFAFEAALAVCAYDLDDASFRDHPYYPRDLVDYYRANIRHTRDAWRAHGVGAGIEIEPPPLPEKLDLAKSKSKGLVRWVELASDGDKDATEAVIEQVGKLRKVKEVSELSCALAENGAGLYADLKDDDTVVGQIDTLLQKRQLEFEAPVAGPNEYAAGIGRCAAVLLALDTWLEDKPYRLLALDTQDDCWQAVLVAQAHVPEFEQLSAALGIGLVDPQQAFDV